jgi:hypothetical protein
LEKIEHLPKLNSLAVLIATDNYLKSIPPLPRSINTLGIALPIFPFPLIDSFISESNRKHQSNYGCHIVEECEP